MLATGTRIAVPGWVHAAATRVWASRRARITLIAVVVWHLVGALAVLCAPLASADPSSGDGGGSGGTASLSTLMGWMNLKDSHGINTANYYLSIDQGGATHPIRAMFAYFTIVEYSAYRIVVGLAIWFIRQVLSFRWLQLIVAPVSDIGDALSVMTSHINLVPVAFALAGAAMAVWIFRGRYTAAAYEALMALFIAAAAVGFLAHPISTIAGDNGLIVKTKNISLEVSAGLANNGRTDANPQANVDKLTASLTDTFLRKPTQLINFGSVLDDRQDGGKCATAFDNGYDPKKKPKEGILDKARDGVVGGIKDLSQTLGDAADAALPGGADPTAAVRDSVAKCPGGDKMKTYAENPGVENMMTAGLLLPAASLVFLFALVLAGRVLLAAAWALFNGLKLIPVTPAAISPVFRGLLMRSLADVAMALCQVAFSVIYICGYSLMINAIFGQSHKVFIETVILVDIALVIAVLLYWKGMGRLHKLSDRLAEIMARRPGVAPVSVARRSPTSATDVMARAQMAKSGARGAVKVGKKVAKAGKLAAEVGGAVASGGSSTLASAATRVAGKAAASKAKSKVADVATSTAADAMGSTVGNVARKVLPGPADGANGGGEGSPSSPQHPGMRDAVAAAALRDALAGTDRSDAAANTSTPLRPGSGTPPTARRHTGAESHRPADTRTPTERVYAVSNDGFNRTTAFDGGSDVLVPGASPSSRSTETTTPADARSPRSAPTQTDTPPAPRRDATRRSSTGPVPASVGSTRIR